MRVVSIIFSILVILVGVVFAMKNATSVNVDFVIYQGTAPLSLALVLAFALGALFGVVVSFIVVLKLKRTISRMEKVHQSEFKDYDRHKQLYSTHQDNA